MEHVKIIGLEEAAGKLSFDQERISEGPRWSACVQFVFFSSSGTKQSAEQWIV